MSVRVGINGFGRIGKSFLRAMLAQGADLEVVAVNDVTTPAVHAHLLAHDSILGTFTGEVVAEPDAIVVDGRRIAVFMGQAPVDLPWGELGVDVVVESTGRYTDRAGAAGHLAAGARRVVISAPSEDADATFVMGVNDDSFDPATDVVISNASCTTNCFVPMVKVLDDAFGVVSGLMTTVHAYTSDQNLVDFPHKDLRRARAAADQHRARPRRARRGRRASCSRPCRVAWTGSRCASRCRSGPSPTSPPSSGGPRASPRSTRRSRPRPTGPMKGILVYSEAPLVSSDIVGSPASCTFDAPLTMVQPIDAATSLVKTLGWYDNEWGYSNRLVDLVRLVGGR